MGAIRSLAVRVGDDAIDAVSMCLRDKHEDVRLAALWALVAVASQGHEENALCVACACIEDPDAGVRETAVDALGQLPCRGDVSAISAVRAGLLDAHPNVRAMSVRSAVVFDLRDEELLDFVRVNLEDCEVRVRCAAVELLRKHVGRGCDGFVDILIPCIMDSSAGVQCAAMCALREIAAIAEDQVALLVCKCLEQPHGYVRAWALQTLSQMFGARAAWAVKVAEECMGDACVDVRCAAVDVFVAVARRSTADTTSVLCEAVADPDIAVRRAALRALREVAVGGGESVVTVAAAASLGDQDASVRLAALRTLGAVAAADDQRVITAASACLADSDFGVHREAFTLLEGMRRPNVCAAKAVRTLSSHSDVGVRRRSVELLGILAATGDQEVTGTLVTCSQDWNAGVRRAALEALSDVAQAGHANAVSAASACLADMDAGVRSAAWSACKCLSARDVWLGDTELDAAVLALGREGPQLHDILRAARPSWSSKDLAAVRSKLARVGVNSVQSLSDRLSSGLNLRLKAAGLRTFSGDTLAAFRLALAKQQEQGVHVRRHE